MKVEIQIDENCTVPKVTILTSEITEEILSLVNKLSQEMTQVLSGFCDDVCEIIEPNSVIRIYAASGKIFAVTDKKEYILKQRLYELEERLDKTCFVRISNSEIVNLRKVKKFDLNFSGTICVSLCNGTTTYVSRRYVKKIKYLLGLI